MTRTVINNRRRTRSHPGAWLCLVVSAVLLLPLFATPGSADSTALSLASSEPAPAVAAVTAAQAQPAAAMRPPARRFSLDFVATDMVDVIKALSAQSGANIALSGKVTGEVTLRLTDITVQEALAVVTKLNGLDFALLGNTWIVGTPEEVKAMTAPAPAPDVPQTKVVALKFLPADDAIALLSNAEPQLKCSASPTGGLILIAVPPVLDRAAVLLAGVDTAPAVGVADRAVYTVKYADCFEMITTLKAVFPDLTVTPAPRSATPIVTPGGARAETGMTALAAPQLSAGGASGSYSGGAGTTSGAGGSGKPEMSPITKLVLSGAPATLARALKLCKELDVPPLQVKISATITEVRSDVESRLGINWQDLAGKAGLVVGEVAPAKSSEGLAGGTIAARGLKLGNIQRSNLSIAGAINALVTEGKARIMANPSVIILDGRQATIHAGDKIFYPQVIGYTPLGGQIVQATEIDVGVTLMVNPRIGPEGDITLTLVPTISSISTSVFAGYPTITERSTVTTVRIKHGETLAIGGLMRDDETVSINKVPLLGDIPIIGDLLFKSKVKHPFRSEVVIIITPEIVGAT